MKKLAAVATLLGAALVLPGVFHVAEAEEPARGDGGTSANPGTTKNGGTSPASASATPSTVDAGAAAAPAPKPPESTPPKTAPRSRPIPLTFVVSGGVSLGSYEAGFLHYVVESAKLAPDVFDVRIATGASAGSINGLLTLLAGCDEKSTDPKASLFYTTWTDIGFPGLYDERQRSPIALFSRRTMDAVSDRILARVERGFPEQCDVVLGVTTTRLSAKRDALAQRSQLDLPRAEERFVVRMRGQGVGKPTKFENYVDPRYGFPQVLLPFEGTARPATLLRDLLYASSAFPFAFEPVSLPYCMTSPRAPDAPCVPASASRAAFVDGGVFDNQPLGLASRLAGDGLEAGGNRARFASPLVRKNALPSDDAIVVYVDPELTSYSRPPDKSEKERMASASALGMHYVEMFVESARTKELMSVLEATPDLRERLAIAATDVPPVSQSLASFFGFFDKRFRELDFYLGMRAARRFMETRLAERVSKVRGDKPTMPHYEDVARRNMEPYRCIRAILDDDGSPGDACRPVAPELRAALQTSIARLYDRCAGARELGSRDYGESPSCARAMRGAEPPRVPYVPGVAAGFYRKRESESELGYVVRLLVAYGFVFRDLGLKKADADRVERQIHENLREVLDTFASAQPENGAAVGSLSRALLGTLTYVPASAIVHVSIGPVLETGASFRLGAGRSRFLRGALAVDMGGLSSFSGGGGAYVTLAPMLGIEAEILPLAGPMLQPRVGLRGGYLFSSEDGFATGGCTDGASRVCSRPTAQAYVAASLFDRVRLQLAFAMLFAQRRDEDFSWSILPTGGIQFLWP